MRLRYGGYTHQDNEVWFTISKRRTYSPRGRADRVYERWDIRGVLIGSSQSDLTSKMGQLQAAYSVDGGDLVFLDDNGAPTHHALMSGTTVDGSRVVSFAWLPGGPGWGSGTEYVNIRSYAITVLGEVVVASDNLWYYKASIQATGTCGAKKIWMPSLTGLPQQQYVQMATTQKVIQLGANVGLNGYISADPPLWPPDVEHVDRRQVTIGSPMEIRIGGSFKYPTRWMYIFESPTPLV